MVKSVKKPTKCMKDVVLRDFVYVCERENGHALGHLATAKHGKTVVKVGWFNRDTLTDPEILEDLMNKGEAYLNSFRIYLGKLWDVLVEHADASADGKDAFISCAEQHGIERTFEYRFVGSLGFGGKIWLNNGDFPYVNCYREDETPQRERIIRVTNEALKLVKAPE